MKVYNTISFTPKIDPINKRQNKFKMVIDSIPDLSHDTIEISTKGRQLAVGVIEHTPARYYGTAEINDSLNKILDNKPPEVSKAVYTTIEFNFIPDGRVSDDEERAALLEIGLSQAKFIADNYLTGEEAAEFLATMDKIAAIAKTRTINPATGEATYITPPEKPKGAPDDYVSTGELMKRFEPNTYSKLQDAIVNGGDWYSILIDFAKKVPQNKEWIKKYKEETDKLIKDLENTKIENRFKDADTSDMFSFLKDMNSIIQNTSFANTDFLTRNMEYFAHILRYKA